MKKLILSVTALSACSLGAYAQGVITFNSSSGGGVVTLDGALDTTTDINAELLWSSTGVAGSFNPVSQLLLSSSGTSSDGTPGFDPSYILSATGDIKFKGNGSLYEVHGNSFVLPSPGASGSTQYFEVEGWLGATESSLAAAQAAGFATGTSAVFTEVPSVAGSPINASLSNMPTLALSVPEPSSLAMAGVGLASMLIFRRRNK